MVLSYVRPHNNLLACSTGCLLLLAFVIQATSPFYFFTFFLLSNFAKMCINKGFVVVVVEP